MRYTVVLHMMSAEQGLQIEIGTPTVSMEARGLSGVTRQTYLSGRLAEIGITTIFFDPHSPAAFTNEGLIAQYATADGYIRNDPDGRTAGAWRLRDMHWPKGDMAAFPPGQGYNSFELRHNLQTRSGVHAVLGQLGLAGMSVPIFRFDPENPRDIPEGEQIFVKPDPITDVGPPRPEMLRRARLLDADSGISAQLLDLHAKHGALILQPKVPTMSKERLFELLGVRTEKEYHPNSLCELRVFQPLWKIRKTADIPAVELRLHSPKDFGQTSPTFSHLLTARHAFWQLPALRNAHAEATAQFAAAYGIYGYLAFDYNVHPDESASLRNVLIRAYTPSLDPKAHKTYYELARRTADVELEMLVSLATGQIAHLSN